MSSKGPGGKPSTAYSGARHRQGDTRYSPYDAIRTGIALPINAHEPPRMVAPDSHLTINARAAVPNTTATAGIAKSTETR